MASPAMSSQPAAGNLLAPTTLGSTTFTTTANSLGVLIDYSTVYAGILQIEMTTLTASGATSGCSISVFDVVAVTSLTASQNKTDTQFQVASTSGIVQNRHVFIGVAGAMEYVKVGAFSSGHYACPALLYAHANGEPVYLVTETARIGPTILGVNAAVANTPYGTTFTLDTGQYIINLTNTDTTNNTNNSISVWLSSRTIGPIS